MEENKLTAKEIFVQLTILQEQLTKNLQTSLHHLSGAIATIVGEDGEETESRSAEIAEVCDVFKTRELNIMKLLEMYERMYNDIRKDAEK